MKVLVTFLATLVLLGLGAGLYAQFGVYNVAATEPHWQITEEVIEFVRDRSIAVHSQGVRVSAVGEAQTESEGFPHYHEMCRLCHGAPGYPRTEFAEGLYPAPPDLGSGRVQKELGAAEIYWIVKNGLKMTGMPAFGPTHSEDKLLAIVSFTEGLPKMGPDRYRELAEASEKGERHAGNGHVEGHGESRKAGDEHGQPANHGSDEEHP